MHIRQGMCCDSFQSPLGWCDSNSELLKLSITVEQEQSTDLYVESDSGVLVTAGPTPGISCSIQYRTAVMSMDHRVPVWCGMLHVMALSGSGTSLDHIAFYIWHTLYPA